MDYVDVEEYVSSFNIHLRMGSRYLVGRAKEDVHLTGCKSHHDRAKISRIKESAKLSN